LSHREHKDRQVCRQVFEALALALAELDFDELALAAVDPAPDAKRVLVTLVPVRRDVDLDAAHARIVEAMTDLREEVAAAVHRKRGPELTFRIDLSG